MLRTALPTALAISLFTVACSHEGEPEPTSDLGVATADVERGPIGKADKVGSCLKKGTSFCGGKAQGNCWCDDLCAFFGDCCDDYEPVCLAPTCDPTLICTQALTCVDGELYPTGCGPDNCDEPLGACGEEPAGKACGGWLADTCGEEGFCKFEGPNCDWADQTGTCQPRPELCPAVFDPVCGCDGQTYGNACEARRAGTDVVSDGPCG